MWNCGLSRDGKEIAALRLPPPGNPDTVLVGFWLNLQLALDLYNAAQAEAETLARIQPFPRPDLEDDPDDAGDGGEYAGEYRAATGKSGESTDSESSDGKMPEPAQIQPQAD